MANANPASEDATYPDEAEAEDVETSRPVVRLRNVDVVQVTRSALALGGRTAVAQVVANVGATIDAPIAGLPEARLGERPMGRLGATTVTNVRTATNDVAKD